MVIATLLTHYPVMSEDVISWLDSQGLGRYAENFAENDVDADILPELSETDLEKLGVTLGHRKKLLKAIAALSVPSGEAAATPGGAAATPSHDDPGNRSSHTTNQTAERRQLTVMFCDLVGSTALSEALELEEYRDLIAAYQSACTDAVEAFEGYVARYLGDGLLVYFGYPQAHEDDAERAVRAALAVIPATRALSPPRGITLQVRIGIATGRVVAGDIVGRGSSEERAVLGETPNLAARLQALAGPGEILVSEATKRLTARLFRCEDAGRHELKGFSRPVNAWRVISEAASGSSRFEATRSPDATPLMGRDAELMLLLERWERVRDAEGQVMLLSGEPGIGKSRLAHSFLARIESSRSRVELFQCSPHRMTSAYYPFVSRIQRAAGIEHTTSAEQKLKRFETWVASEGGVVARSAPLVENLLSVDMDDRSPLRGLEPRQVKEKTILLLTERLVQMSEDAPLVVLFEDVHWADPTTLEVIGALVVATQRIPLLLIITHRPSFASPWPVGGYITHHSLARLGRRQIAAIVNELGGDAPLPKAVIDEIVEKTDGIPLFVEELTKAVVESRLTEQPDDAPKSGRIRTALSIPSTLQDSLSARLDRLGQAKGTAQIAAVIGREFGRELVAALSPLDADTLERELARLENAGLVTTQVGGAGDIMVFKHALVQDAAYESLLKSDRARLHGRLAEILEDRFPRRASEEPELLARHFDEAGLVEKALEYRWRAADLALRRSAYHERLAQLNLALGLLDAIPDRDQRLKDEIDVQIARGGALMATQGFRSEDTGNAFARARVLSEAVGEHRQTFAALRGLHGVQFTRANLDEALEAAEACLRIAKEGADQQQLSLANRLVGQTLQMRGQFAAGRQLLEQALSQDSGQRSEEVAALITGGGHRLMIPAFLAQVLWLQGFPDRALALAMRGLREAEQRYGAFPVTACLFFLCWIHGWRGEYDAVSDAAERIRRLAMEHEIAEWVSPGGLLADWRALATGKGEGAADLARSRLDEVRALSGVMTPFKLGVLAEALGETAPDQALDAVEEALGISDRGERWSEPELWRIKGCILQRSAEKSDQAEACFQRSLELARAQGARSWELRTATSLARLWSDNGDRERAHSLLAPVYGGFTEGLETADLRAAKECLTSLSQPVPGGDGQNA